MTEEAVFPFVGIDVSKVQLDTAICGETDTLLVPNDPAGIQQLLEFLQPRTPELIVLEATGGFETPAVAGLAARRPHGRRSQPSPGPRLCQGHWPTGKDRSTRRSDPRPLRRLHAAFHPPPTR